MLNISCLKEDSDQTKFRFGISVKNYIEIGNFRENSRKFIFHRKELDISERIQLIFEVDRDIDVTMLCKNLRTVRRLFLELSCKRLARHTDRF